MIIAASHNPSRKALGYVGGFFAASAPFVFAGVRYLSQLPHFSGPYGPTAIILTNEAVAATIVPLGGFVTVLFGVLAVAKNSRSRTP